MKALRIFAIAALSLLPHVCLGFWFQNIVYSDKERETSNPSIFMDRMGDFYPAASVHVDVEKMRCQGVPRKQCDGNTVATLRRYFLEEFKSNSTIWNDLLRSVEALPSGNFDKDWGIIQSKLRSKATGIMKNSSGMEVLLVVQGYNSDYSRTNEWLDSLHRPGLHLVALYWDGLTGSKTGIGPWGEAQYNGPRVGQSLRTVLNQLDPDTRLRIFTHSSGAFVVTNALGNGGGSFDGFVNSPELKQRAGALQGDYRIPSNLTDLRVAMLVPAQPLSAFDHYRDERGSDTSFQGVVPNRLILGTSRRDLPTSKHILFCWMFGDTCMSVKPKKACSRVRSQLSGTPSSVVIVNFPKPLKGYFHEHAVLAYKQDSTQWNELIRQLFDEEPGTPQGTVDYCHQA